VEGAIASNNFYGNGNIFCKEESTTSIITRRKGRKRSLITTSMKQNAVRSGPANIQNGMSSILKVYSSGDCNLPQAMSLCISDNISIREPVINTLAVRSSLEDLSQRTLICNELIMNKSFEHMNLSSGGNKILTTDNAGGNSVTSEVLSYEIMKLMYGAALKRTEMEITYSCQSKITDYSVCLYGTEVGISVTRAMKFCGYFDEHDATRLLTKKLKGINESSRNVIKQHKWKKQILHIFAHEEYIAQQLIHTYHQLTEDYKSNTIVMITISSTTDSKTNRIFFERNTK
jgi:hypothetical protein